MHQAVVVSRAGDESSVQDSSLRNDFNEYREIL